MHTQTHTCVGTCALGGLIAFWNRWNRLVSRHKIKGRIFSLFLTYLAIANPIKTLIGKIGLKMAKYMNMTIQQSPRVSRPSIGMTPLVCAFRR